MSKRVFLILMMVLLLLTLVSAQNGKQFHMKLLAVQENLPNNYTGSDADLYLELKEGSGRVFLETFPLTKADTQISTRFAKEIACKHFKLDCNKYDFIYTIKAKSNIIGGPSAGAAIAALTAIALLDLDYDKTITITGTANSGAIIGPVGGVKEKLEAAADIGLKRVLIAKGSSEFKLNETEEAVNLIQYASSELGLEVVEVMDLDEVIFHLTGKEFNNRVYNISEDAQYSEIMAGLQRVLCKRTDQIEEELRREKIVLDNVTREEIDTRKENAVNSSEREDFYSAASYCFGTNIQIKNEYYNSKKLSKAQIDLLFSILDKKVNAAKKKINQEKIETISDLQTLMIVEERLNDVKKQITSYQENVDKPVADFYNTLGYAEERFFSALTWMQFFSMDGKKFNLDEEALGNSCQFKLMEAEQRYQHISLFIGDLQVTHIREKLNSAGKARDENNYPLCLITAVQAKAESNAILSSIGVSEDSLNELFTGKSHAVERVIFENSQEGIFPILGYSYYKYANSLVGPELYTPLLYLEYALEMSDLSIYFPEKEVFVQGLVLLDSEWILVLEGFLLGILVTLIVLSMKDYLFVKKRKK